MERSKLVLSGNDSAPGQEERVEHSVAASVQSEPLNLAQGHGCLRTYGLKNAIDPRPVIAEGSRRNCLHGPIGRTGPVDELGTVVGRVEEGDADLALRRIRAD